ncbi:MAG: tetratricopeptide repeat protein [Desulfobacteraceae bacterium]|nr:tetratricopeptide repeat protein [Desulfobacteraceae bacterium]MBC2720292.1 tetratricopeptide repeat protein [Desulfobacteraceae bacterium]
MMQNRLIYIESVVLASLVLLFGTVAYQRNFVWKTEETLWSDAVIKSTNKDRPHVNIGNSYFKKGLLDQAMVEYKMAVKINPVHPYAKTYYNLGVVYEKKGMFNDATDAYQQALTIKPGFLEALDNLGNTYLKMGHINKAIEKYKMAMSIKPDSPEPHWNLGMAYERKRIFDKAIFEFQKYLHLRPDDAQARAKIGNLLFQIHASRKE